MTQNQGKIDALVALQNANELRHRLGMPPVNGHPVFKRDGSLAGLWLLDRSYIGPEILSHLEPEISTIR